MEEILLFLMTINEIGFDVRVFSFNGQDSKMGGSPLKKV